MRGQRTPFFLFLALLIACLTGSGPGRRTRRVSRRDVRRVDRRRAAIKPFGVTLRFFSAT